MATLQPNPGWDDVYQLEVTDPAQGGADGVLNRQPQALLNRTAYLRALLDSIETELQGKAPIGHNHDASAITSGLIDPARIPVLPSQNTVTSSSDLSALTEDQQALVVEGVIVTSADGWRWVYKGSGSKTDSGSYIQLADITPDWSVIQNKPASFSPLAHSHVIGDVTGLQDALNAKADASSWLFTDINGASTFMASMIASKNGQCDHGSAITLPSFGAYPGLALAARPARTDEISTLMVGEHNVGWGSGGEATAWGDTFSVDPDSLAVTATRSVVGGGGGANSGGTGTVNYSVVCLRRYA